MHGEGGKREKKQGEGREQRGGEEAPSSASPQSALGTQGLGCMWSEAVAAAQRARMSVGQTMLWEGDGEKGEGSKVPGDRQRRQSEDLWEGNEQTVKGELGENKREEEGDDGRQEPREDV